MRSATQWGLVCEQPQRGAVQLLAACLIPDHLHLLAKPAAAPIPRWMNSLKSYAAKVAHQHGHIGELWQPSYWDRALRADELDSAVDYILRNPVSAGYVDAVDDWPWVGTWLGKNDDG